MDDEKLSRKIDPVENMTKALEAEHKLLEQAINSADTETLSELYKKSADQRKSLVVAIGAIIENSKAEAELSGSVVIDSMERVALAAIDLAKASLNGKGGK